MNHYSWFQGDGIHLVHEGAMAIAALFHGVIDAAVDPVVIAPASLPVARVGHRYSARLVARGGPGPYRWSIVRGSLPKGLSLRPGGGIVGVPRRLGRVSIVVRALDSRGLTDTRPVTLRITSAE